MPGFGFGVIIIDIHSLVLVLGEGLASDTKTRPLNFIIAQALLLVSIGHVAVDGDRLHITSQIRATHVLNQFVQ